MYSENLIMFLALVNAPKQFNDLSFVETIPVRAFRLEPDGNRGIFSVDGEVSHRVSRLID